MVLLATTAAIISVMLWIISGTISKRIARGLGIYIVPFIIVTLGLAPMLIATVLAGQYQLTLESVVVASVAGIFLSLGFILAYKALETQKLATTSAFGEIQPAALVILGLLVFGEHITPVEIVGIIVIFIGATLVITTEKFKINRGLLPAFLSNICWSFYWILMTFSVISAGTYAFPLLISRVAGMVIVVIYLLTNRRALASLKGLGTKIKGSRTIAALVVLTIIAAFADASGDTVFGITISSTVLAIGGALVALSPMITSFFGFLFYRERLRRIEIVGLLIMVSGALAVTVL